MTNKLIKDVDEETWVKFIAYCKLKGVRVGNELTSVLKEYTDKRFTKLLKGEAR